MTHAPIAAQTQRAHGSRHDSESVANAMSATPEVTSLHASARD
jgi:hypothetical protein